MCVYLLEKKKKERHYRKVKNTEIVKKEHWNLDYTTKVTKERPKKVTNEWKKKK